MYIIFLWDFLVVLLMVFLPGVFLSAVVKTNKLKLEYLPIPGVILLAVFGLMMWLAESIGIYVLRWLMISFYLFMLVSVLVLVWRGFYRPRFASVESYALFVYLCVLMQAVSIGINPLPIGQEFGLGSDLPGRMIASPPDHAIPLQTAYYFLERLNGNEKSEEFFGVWGLGARGPLVPFGINAILQSFGFGADNTLLNVTWPIGNRGQHLAKIYGWILNSLVVFGVMGFLRQLKADRLVWVTTLTWVGLAPVVMINVVFVWPKLLATYYLLMLTGSAKQENYRVAGLMMALAWLSHPVGALFIPAAVVYIYLIQADRSWVKASRNVILTTLVCIITVLPWLYFKMAILKSADPFMGYFLGGGDGLVAASDFGAWLKVRWNNLWYTLVPFAFFKDGLMKVWVYGPLNEPLRWFTQYAKALPGELGFSCFITAYLALFRFEKNNQSSAMIWLIVSAFMVMLVFWGYSGDGLGRNSLEPLVIFIIIFTCAHYRPSSKWLYITFPVLAVEGQALQLAGYIFASNDIANISLNSGRYHILVSLLTTLLLLMFYYKSRVLALVEYRDGHLKSGEGV